MKLLFRLLRKNVNVWQLAGFAVANLVGAVIVLFGVQAYKDAAKVLKSPDSVIKSNVFVLSKSVSGVSSIANILGSGPRSFSGSNIEEIRSIPGVTNVASFRTANFDVYGSIYLGGFSASTEMFLESVPDEFLEIQDEGWTADLNSSEIPVIIPQTYLNFFNYGFATARDVPQISESLLSTVSFNIRINGKRTYKGRIVGLTDRFNTILVPDDFLEAANDEYGHSGKDVPVSRVILETDGASSADALMQLITSKGYVIDGGSEDTLRMLSVVRRIISVVVALGLLVSALAFFLLLISILLLIEKNKYKNDTLHQLGYPDTTIAFPYQALALAVDVAVWVLAFVITIISYPAVTKLMQTISPDFTPDGPGLLILSSLGLCVIFAIVHIALIRSKIRNH